MSFGAELEAIRASAMGMSQSNHVDQSSCEPMRHVSNPSDVSFVACDVRRSWCIPCALLSALPPSVFTTCRSQVGGVECGENLAWGSPTYPGPTATRDWYKEIDFTSPYGTADSMSDSTPAGKDIGHYTQAGRTGRCVVLKRGSSRPWLRKEAVVIVAHGCV